MTTIQIFYTVLLSIIMPSAIIFSLYLKTKGVTQKDFNRHGFYWGK